MSAQLPGSFNPAEVKASDNTLPMGPYKLAITKTDVKPSKQDPNNLVYTLEMDVQDGPCQGRKIFTTLSLVNSNQQAVDIANRELKAIVEACGLPALKADLDELIGIPFMGDVVTDVSKNPQYQDKSKVKKYYPCGASATPQVIAPSPSAGPWGAR